MKEITKDTIDLIVSDKLDVQYWLGELSSVYISAHKLPITSFSNNIHWGEKFWRKIEDELRSLLCDAGAPKQMIQEIISGDIRNLAQTILSIIVASYEISIAIAIPITALVLKRGINNFCKKEDLSSRNPNLINDILNSKDEL